MKKTLSLLLVLALLMSLFTGMALNAGAAEDAVLSVYTQTGEGEAVLAKGYTAEELAALAEKSEGAAYVYYKKDAPNAVVATEYVTLSALLADAGVTFAEGDSIAFTCTDGPYGKYQGTYEDLNARGVDADGNAVPTAFALTWEQGNLSETTAAAIAAEAKNTGNVRFVSGMTAAEAEGKNAAGMRMPSGVLSITVVSPVKPALSVYTQTGEGEAVLAKSYTADELAALAEKSEGAAYVYYKKDAPNAVVATEYVTLSALLADAGVTFAEGDSIAFTCTDGPYGKYQGTYEDLNARGVDADGNAVPTAFALTWEQGNLSETTAAAIAAEAKNTGNVRFVSGMTAAEAEGKNAAGMRMPSGVLSITVVTPVKPVLEIYTQAGKGGPEKLAKGYTAEELAALAEKSEGAAYVYYKKDAPNAVVATEYVTLSALLADAGVTFAEGDSIAFTCTDGPYGKYRGTYEDLSERGVDADGNAVPTAFALTWEQGNLSETTAAAIAAEAKNTGNIRFVSGMTAAEAEGKNAAGMRMPSGVLSITVVGQPVVQPTKQGLKVDGEAKETEVYNISGYNYFKLRDIAALLNGTAAQFSVGFDVATHTVFVETGKAYTLVGGELTTGTDKSASCVLSNWTVQVNGEVKDIVAYNLADNNFFKLQDLGNAIGFGVEYDKETDTMLITSK